MTEPKKNILTLLSDTNVRFEGNYIIVFPDGPNPYEISLDRIPDEAALLHWTYHLSSKLDCDREVLRSFILIAASAKDFSLGPVS